MADTQHAPDGELTLNQELLIEWIGGGKGGVGKSTVTIAKIDHLIATGRTPLLIETDTSNPDVAKIYGHTVKTELLDLDTRDGWLSLLTLCESADRPVVINTGSRNSVAVSKYAPLFRLGLEELNAKLVCTWVINEHRDSLELLLEFRHAFPHARVHVLRNLHCAPSFPLYDASDLRKQIEAEGGKSLDFPDLASRVTRELYEHRLTLQAAACQMPFGSRIEIKRWRREVNAVFEAAR